MLKTLARNMFQPAIMFVVVTSACAVPVGSDGEESIAMASAALAGCAPELPEELEVPRGHALSFSLYAAGVQIYDCTRAADGTFSWLFRAPEADLFARHGRFAGIHYGGPTWEGLDGSAVVASRLSGVTVDTTAIPWLLLQATSHYGKGRMDGVTYLQRVKTAGGLAPSSGCDAAHVGEEVEVDYTAIYNFYEAKRGHKRP